MERMAMDATLAHASLSAIVESVYAKKGAQRPANKQFQALLKRLTDGESG